MLSCVYLCTEYLNKFVVICKNMLILRYATRKYSCSCTSFSTSFASVLTFVHIQNTYYLTIVPKLFSSHIGLYDHWWLPFVLARYFLISGVWTLKNICLQIWTLIYHSTQPIFNFQLGKFTEFQIKKWSKEGTWLHSFEKCLWR